MTRIVKVPILDRRVNKKPPQGYVYICGRKVRYFCALDTDSSVEVWIMDAIDLRGRSKDGWSTKLINDRKIWIARAKAPKDLDGAAILAWDWAERMTLYIETGQKVDLPIDQTDSV